MNIAVLAIYYLLYSMDCVVGMTLAVQYSNQMYMEIFKF